MMKGIRGRIIRKLKSISTLTSLNPSLAFQQLQTSSINPRECHDQKNGTLAELLDSPDHILVPDIFKDAQEGELVSDYSNENEKTESKTPIKSEDKLGAQDLSKETEKTLQGEKDSNICKLSFSDKAQTQLEHKRDSVLPPALQTNSPRTKKLLECTTKKGENGCEDHHALLQEFEEKCPPGGSESVVFYTTSFRGIRKTFEDCSAIRFLLESFRVVFYERDVSMHLEYREELWMVLGRKVVPPRLFIRGRDIGGADEVVGLHEQGLLWKLLVGIPLIPSNRPCNGCGGVRFVLCLNCNGSRKITTERQGREVSVRCLDCNENGLVKCSICS